MTALAPTGLAPRGSTSVDDAVVGGGAVTALAGEERAFAEFVRLHVAGGAAAADTVAGYLREARLFRDRFLAPRGLALAALTEDDVIEYRHELVEAGFAVTTIGTKLSALRRLLDARRARRCAECKPGCEGRRPTRSPRFGRRSSAGVAAPRSPGAGRCSRRDVAT